MSATSYRGARQPKVTPVADVPPWRLIVRCLVERKGDQWQAFTLELGLAAQGDSEADVRRKLENMILCYVRDAMVGEDREHAGELMCRRATVRVYLKYYLVAFCKAVVGLFARQPHHHDKEIYSRPLPLQPLAA